MSASRELSESLSKCGFVALIGATNAGKSTLMNALTGRKLAAVSRKVNTTRRRIRGILTRDQVQVIFVDTPGLSNHPRNRAPQEIAPDEAADADKTLLLVDAVRGTGEDELSERVLAAARGAKGLSLVINKIDLVDREKLLLTAQHYTQALNPEKVFMVSALTGSGLDDLTAFTTASMPKGAHLFNTRDDLSESETVVERLREQVYDLLHDELPYTVEPETESIHHRADGSMHVRAFLKVTDARQKPMLIGAGGSVLRRLGTRARIDLSACFGRPVHLFLTVKVS